MIQKRNYQQIIFKIILNKVQNKTLVRASGLKDKLGSINVDIFKKDVKGMLNHMQSIYEKILAINQTLDNIILHRFWALK